MLYFSDKLGEIKLECRNDINRRMRVSGNRVVRKIFGSKADDVTAEWRRLHSEDLNDSYCSPHIVRVIQSRRRWAEHLALWGRGKVNTGF